LTHILGVNTLPIHLRYIVTQKAGIRYPVFLSSGGLFPADEPNPGGDCQI
jgi:hypothetical protein